MINSELIKLARQSVERQKFAFQPPQPGGDPAAGGGGMPPGGDPSQMGGMPPGAGGAPPMDPSMGGGQPPMPPTDPSGGGGSAMGPQPVTMEALQQMMQQMMAQMQNSGGAGGQQKQVKQDINTIAMDIFQVKKMLGKMMQTLGLEMDSSLLDGPNRHPETGMPLAPNTPGSTSDPNAQQGSGAQPPPMDPGAISPIGGMQGATPTPKTASVGTPNYYSQGKVVKEKAAAINAILKKRKQK